MGSTVCVDFIKTWAPAKRKQILAARTMKLKPFWMQLLAACNLKTNSWEEQFLWLIQSLFKRAFILKEASLKRCARKTHSKCNVFWKLEVPNAIQMVKAVLKMEIQWGHLSSIQRAYTESKEIYGLRKRKTKDLFFPFTKAWDSVPRTRKFGQHGTWPMEHGSVMQQEILWLYLLFNQIHVEI